MSERKLVLSRELLHLAIERGAAEGVRRYVEGVFAVQHPNCTLALSNLTVSADTISEVNLRLTNGFEIEYTE